MPLPRSARDSKRIRSDPSRFPSFHGSVERQSIMDPLAARNWKGYEGRSIVSPLDETKEALMRKVLFLFGQLTDADIGWLAKAGRRQRLPAGAVLIHEGVPVETLYILLEGSLTVVRESAKKEIARLGVGEVVGEMSFIDARPPSATVRASTAVVVYAISTQRLRQALEEDVALAAHFYKAIA